MVKHLVSLATALSLGPLSALGASQEANPPRVVSVEGTLEDGSVITVRGHGFGRHGLGVEWTGGGTGFIERSAVKTRMRDVGGRWGESLASAATPAHISDEMAHSHRHAIKGWVDSEVRGSWQSGFEYAHPRRFQEVYASWWAFAKPIDGDSGNCTGPQWKMFRLNDGPPHTRVNDHPGEIALGSNYCLVPPEDCPRGKTQMRIHLHAGNPACGQGSEECKLGRCACNDWSYPSGNSQDRYREITPDDYFHWARWELFARRSGVDEKNGTLELWLTVPGSPPRQVAEWIENFCTHRDLTGDPSGKKPWGVTETPESWIYLIWQNYYGSAREGLRTRAEFFIDDIYLQFETGKARVELGNAPFWTDCDHREIQAPSAWADDAITVTLNRGSFAPGEQVYLFVFRSDGTVGEGFPVELE